MLGKAPSPKAVRSTGNWANGEFLLLVFAEGVLQLRQLNLRCFPCPPVSPRLSGSQHLGSADSRGFCRSPRQAVPVAEELGSSQALRVWQRCWLACVTTLWQLPDSSGLSLDRR